MENLIWLCCVTLHNHSVSNKLTSSARWLVMMSLSVTVSLLPTHLCSVAHLDSNWHTRHQRHKYHDPPVCSLPHICTRANLTNAYVPQCQVSATNLFLIAIFELARWSIHSHTSHRSLESD